MTFTHQVLLFSFLSEAISGGQIETTHTYINSSHSVSHLFGFPARPTTLTTKDLDRKTHAMWRIIFDQWPLLTIYLRRPRPLLPARPPAAPPNSLIFSPISLPPSFPSPPSSHSTNNASNSPSISGIVELKLMMSPLETDCSSNLLCGCHRTGDMAKQQPDSNDANDPHLNALGDPLPLA